MERACWQYEDEPVRVGFDDDSLYGLQPAEYKRVKNPWEFASLDTEELQAEEEKQQKAKEYKFLKPWELPQSSQSIVNDFDKNLERLDYKGKCPYDDGSVSLDVLNEQKKLSAKDYRYKPMWEKLELTVKQAEQIKNYKLVTPYERQGLPSKVEDKDLKEKVDKKDNNKSIAPWAVGALPGDKPAIKINPPKQTTLWNDETKSKAPVTIESSGDPILDSLRLQLKQRGAGGVIGLAKKFKIMDDNGNGTLDMNEFKKAMKECKISDISDKAMAHLFRYFDKDDSGSINYDEFLVGIRGVLSARRLELVNLAFTVLDKDGSGLVDINDIQGVYTARSHPDVIGGRRTEEEILIEFIDNFNVVKKNIAMKGSVAKDNGKKPIPEKAVAKGTITRDMFIDYYSNLSSSIDSDDYFELMIRNSWHISGGEGWSANTTNKRVLVKHMDGRETVEEIKNDLGLKANDKVGMVQRLRAQGIAAAAVNTTGGSENGRGGDGSSDADVAYYNLLRSKSVSQSTNSANTHTAPAPTAPSKPTGRVLLDVFSKNTDENVNPVNESAQTASVAKTVYIPANLKALVDNSEKNLAKTYPLRASQKKNPQPLGAYRS